MRRLLALLTISAAASAQQTQPFTLQQILSAPYALSLTASPVGAKFAWVENAEGVRNLWVSGNLQGDPTEPAHAITHYTEDDAQDIASLAWSPDGTAIAYTYGAESGASGKPANPAHLQRPTALHIIIQPLDTKLPATDIGEGRSALFTRDGHSLLLLRAGQVWITALSTPSPHQLVYDRGSASQLTLSPDGKQLAYISHRQRHSFLALYDFATKHLTFPSPSTGIDSAPAFSPDGKQIAWLRAPYTQDDEFANNRTSPNPWSIQLADLSTNKTRTVFTAEPNKPGSVLPRMSTGEPRLFWTASQRPGGPSFAPSAKGGVVATSNLNRTSIIFASEADGWVHLYSLDPSGSRPSTLLTPGNFEVEDATLASNARNIYFASNEVTRDSLDVDKRHVRCLNLSSGRIEAVGATRLGIETHPQLSGEGIAALLSDDTYPMHPAVWTDGYWLFLHPLDPAVSAFPDGRVAHPKQILFKSTDGLEIHAQIFEPKATAPKHPAIVFVHGGPKRQMLLGYPSMDYYSNAYAMNQYLASRGFIVLSVNYRGGIGYGLNFREAEHQGAQGAAEYNDVLAAQKYLTSRPDVDAKRIGIWGGSYGGYLTALALARNSDLFAAGVDFHGVHEWALEDNAPADWLHGTPADPAIPAALAARAHASSPMADIDHWRSPVLLIHGDDDPEVTYAQTPLLADALRARKVPVEELIFPDEVHGFLLHRDWLAAYEATAAFFEKTLHPEK